MKRDGRPLRFLALVLTAWTGVRVLLLWPTAPVAVAREAVITTAAAAAAAPAAARTTGKSRSRSSVRTSLPSPHLPRHRATANVSVSSFTPHTIVDPGLDDRHPTVPGIVAGLPEIPSTPAGSNRPRFFGSAWAVGRGGSGPPGGVPGVQLGGSQAGVRLGFALTADRRLALVGRATSPLGHGMRELALGIEWQPTRLPLRIVAEQRLALGAGRGGPTLAAVGGIGPLPLAAGFRLEAYGQGGGIARDGVEGFADGALRVARPIATPGGVRIDLGAGTWGAAQRGATRLDVGPSLSAVLPVGSQPLRLSLDWRQRVAGNAAPGSGLVATLGADF